MLKDPKDRNTKSILMLLHSLLRERNSACSYWLIYLVMSEGFILHNCLIKTLLNTSNSSTLICLTTCFSQHWWFRENSVYTGRQVVPQIFCIYYYDLKLIKKVIVLSTLWIPALLNALTRVSLKRMQIG